MAETIKAEPRRIREGFFEKYCQGDGIDIGCGDDPIRGATRKWDKQDGDATYMEGIGDGAFDWVHSSHCLEHLNYPHLALRNWLRILKRGGYLSLFLPDRDTYEKRLILPSRFNGDHRTFWLLDRHEPPCTIGIIPLIAQWLEGYDLIYAKKCDEGHAVTDPEQHSNAEYSLEVVIKKV